jgi:hypothetical protein
MNKLRQDLHEWRKSSYSTNTTNCVEVALTSSRAQVRDTKDRAGGSLAVQTAAWAAFTREVRSR